MWELDCEEGWGPKNWCFWTVVLEKTLESPLDCKEINPGISLEGMMLKLKLQYFGHLMQGWLIGKDPDAGEGLGAGGEGDDWGWDGWMASWTRWMWVWVNSGRWWRTRRPGVLWFMGLQRVGHDWATELNWTEWSSGFPYFLQFKSKFGNKEFKIWSTDFVCWLYRAFPSLAAKNIINLILILTIW